MQIFTLKGWSVLEKIAAVILVTLLCSGAYFPAVECQLTTEQSQEVSVLSALVRYSYTDPVTGKHRQFQGEMGRYASNSPVYPTSGLVVHIKTEDGANHGCTVPINKPPNQPWVALVQRGQCKFAQKIVNAAILSNATAVVIYNHLEEEKLITMHHKIDNVMSVFIAKEDGDKIADLADSGVNIQLDISIGQITVYKSVPDGSTGFKPSTFLIVSICLVAALFIGFCVLIVFSVHKTRNKKKNDAKKKLACQYEKPGPVNV